MILNISKEEAEKFGLLTCVCRHPENNHFDHDPNKPCAKCDCKKYREQGRGDIDIMNTIELCPECDGSGETIEKGCRCLSCWISCPICNGLGVIKKD